MAHSITIVALGDSKTEGIGDSAPGGGYPQRLRTRLATDWPRLSVPAIGRQGWTSEDLCTIGLPQALALQPQLALLWIGSNDIWETLDHPQPEAVMNRFGQQVEQMLAAFQQRGIPVALGLLDDQSQRPSVQTSTDFRAEELDQIAARVRSCNALLATLATQYRATIVDFYHTTIFSSPATIAADGSHPNATGYDLITDKWLLAVRPLLPALP